MKKIIFALIFTSAAVFAAQAKTQDDPGTRYTSQFKCVFTEPFITVNYDSYSKNLTTITPESSDTETGVTMKSDQKNKDMILVDKGGRTLLTIQDKPGSDGMSDIEYPLTGLRDQLVGGCHFTFKKVAN